MLAVALLVLSASCSDNDKPLGPTETPATHEPLSESPGLWIGPVHGLTTAWYPAPAKFQVTNDAGKMQLKLVTMDGAIVDWKGAVEVSRLTNVSIAELTLPSAGSNQKVEVTSRTRARDGAITSTTFSTGVTVANHAAAEVQVGAIALSEAKPRLEEYTTPAARMRLLLDGRTIASLTNLGNNAYRTAASSLVHTKTSTTEPGMLLEWRVDGSPTLLGLEGDLKLPDKPGTHVISAGPTAHARTARVETFATTVVVDGSIVAGEPTTFRVTTNPRGFESEVLWMAGTLFGTAEPSTGRGATFTAVFDRPWPTTPDGVICMGVRAGTAAAIVEQHPNFGDDMTRLSTDLADAEKEIGKHICCITDSLTRQQTYDAVNGLVKSRDAINKALSVYNSLSKVTKKAIDFAYGDVEGDLNGQLNSIEAGLAKLKTLPDCTSQAILQSNGLEMLSFCTDLADFFYGFGQAQTALGLFLIAVGLILIWIPGVGQPITLAGILFGTVGALCVLISYGISLLC
jgi:hypothetical protein